MADPASRALIRGSPLELRVIQETGGPAFRRSGRSMELAQTPESRCVFLNSQNLCSVQAELGAASKPQGCHKFPFQFTPTPEGIFVGVSFYCDAAQRNEGRELSHHAESIVALLDQEAFVGDEPMTVHRRVTMWWPTYRALEEWVLADLPGALACLAARVRSARGRPLELTARDLGGPPGAVDRLDSVVDAFWPELIEPLGSDGVEADLPDWAQAELDRYLRALIFRKYLITERPILHNLSILYLVPRLFRLCAGWSQRSRGAAELGMADVYRAFEDCEYHFVTHALDWEKTYARLAQAFCVASPLWDRPG